MGRKRKGEVVGRVGEGEGEGGLVMWGEGGRVGEKLRAGEE